MGPQMTRNPKAAHRSRGAAEESARAKPKAAKRKLIQQPPNAEAEGEAGTGGQELRRLFARKEPVDPEPTLECFPVLAQGSQDTSEALPTNNRQEGEHGARPRSRSPQPPAWRGEPGRHLEASHSAHPHHNGQSRERPEGGSNMAGQNLAKASNRVGTQALVGGASPPGHPAPKKGTQPGSKPPKTRS